MRASLSFVTRKIIYALVTIFAVVSFSFFLFRILPGDPARLIARAGALSPEALENIRKSFGLDKGLATQYVVFVKNAFQGDIGISYIYQQPVSELLRGRMANTLILVGATSVLVFIGGSLLGVLAASHHRKKRDSAIVMVSLAAWSTPTFWIGMLVVLLFGVKLELFPVAGMRSFTAPTGGFDEITDVAHHLVLPALTLAFVEFGQFVLVMRSSLVDVLQSDYVKMARAKGLSERRILWRHGVRTAILAPVTLIALWFGQLMAGTVLVETVFSWPGLGQLLFQSVARQDYPMLQGTFLVIAVLVVGGNLVADLLYPRIDPRVRQLA